MSELGEVKPPLVSVPLPENDELFGRAYDALDDWACALAGVAWANDELFSVETTKTVKYPTSHRSIAKQSKYGITEYIFSGEKRSTGSPNDPYFNVYQLSISDSRPLNFEQIDPSHRKKLIDHYIEYFPETMTRLAMTALTVLDMGGGVDLEDDSVDFDSLEEDTLLEVCEQVGEEAGFDALHTHSVGYIIAENGQVMHYSESYYYQTGPVTYELAAIDSQGSYEYRQIRPHGEQNAEEFVGQPTFESPKREMLTDETPGRLILEDEEFTSIVEVSFGEHDHMGITYEAHIQNILDMIKSARGRTF